MSASLDGKIALVTTTSMTTYLGVTMGSEEEEQVDNVINAASQRAAEATGRGVDLNGYSRLLSTSRTEYYDGDDTDMLCVKAYPISSVTSLYIDVDRDYGSTDLVDSDDYVVHEERGMVELDGEVYVKGPKSVKITYTGGYSTVPYDLQQAVKELVTYWYKRETDKRIGVSSVNVGDHSINYETDIPKAVETVFNRYRDFRMFA